jgi:hypothetical protein
VARVHTEPRHDVVDRTSIGRFHSFSIPHYPAGADPRAHAAARAFDRVMRTGDSYAPPPGVRSGSSAFRHRSRR